MGYHYENKEAQNRHVIPSPALQVIPNAEASLPDPKHVAERIALAAVEVLSGHRSVRQLQRWLAPHIYVELARSAGLQSRMKKLTRLPGRVMNSRVCVPKQGVCEASVVIWDMTRPRACAVRLELHRGRWRANALDVI